MPTLYALLVGVGTYADPRHNLRGCPADIATMKDLLARQAERIGLDYEPLVLQDQSATREAVVKGFDHFKAAASSDYCVFYYSGHGSFAPVPGAFYNDPSGRNESLVCHDSRSPGGRDLMDKELAYLAHRSMHQGQPKFITILDCCHSGSAFRSAEAEEEDNDLIRVRQTSPAGAVAPEDYLGYADYQTIDGKKLPPRYPALHLAACRPDERAQERPIDGLPQGVFTHCLSRELAQAGPHLSVKELMRRVNLRARNLNPKQYPDLEDDGSQRTNQPLFTNADYTPSAEAKSHGYEIFNEGGDWYVNAGSIQNIHPGTPEDPTVFVTDNDREWCVRRVFPHRSMLEEPTGQVNSSQIYAARLSANGREYLKVKLHEKLPADWEKKLQALAVEYPAIRLLAASDDEPAPYRIEKLMSTIVLVRPEQGVPVFKRVSLFDHEKLVDNLREFLDRVNRVAAWEATLRLSNPQTSIPDTDIQATITIEEGDTVTVLREGKDNLSQPIPLHYTSDGGEDVLPLYSVTLKNTSPSRTYWLSVLQSSSDFAVSNDFMAWRELAPGQEAAFELLDDEGPYHQFSAYFPDEYQSWGLTRITDYFRIVISRNDELRTDNFVQDALPLDTKDNAKRGATDRGTRRARPKADSRDWTVKNLAFDIIRPQAAVGIAGGSSASLGGLRISGAPAGFRAKAKLGSMESGGRSLLGRSLPPVFAGGEMLSLSSLTGERDLSKQLNVLELTDVREPDTISADHPLKITPEVAFSATESVVPFGYDPVSGAYYPLGYMDEKGDILIQDIPDEVAEERSLGGSVKIFFQKIVGRKFGIKDEYPLLRRVVENEDGQLVYADQDLKAIRQEIEKPHVKKVVLFVHGIIGDTESSTAILQHLARKTGEAFDGRYQVVLTFDYENLGTNIDLTAQDLKKKLEALGFGQPDRKQLHVFAHSMGGLVSRWLIEKELEAGELVDELYTFGTPHAGSPWSNVMGLLTSAITYGISGATFAQPWMFALMGFERLWKKSQTTLTEMKPGGDFMKRLNDKAKAPIPYTLIAGNTQLVKTEGEEKLRGFIQKLIYRFRHHPHYALLDAGMFKGPNDIAVSLESQQLVRGDLVRKPDPIACDHLSYFNNPACIDLVEELTRES